MAGRASPAMADLENMLTEETLAPDFVDIADDNDPHIIIPGYSIRKEIAKGGMSTVLLAKRLEDDLDVVLKVLFTKGLEDSSGLKRFIQEYDLISAMNHPHIIRIYERAFASEFAYIALDICHRVICQNVFQRAYQPRLPCHI